MTARARSRPRRNEGGFSLIELAVVLVIIGLLIGGGLAAFEIGNEQTRRSQQRHQFEAVRAALYGYAMSRGRLPCPDTDDPPDGVEDPAGGSPACAAEEGALPWVDLGIDRRDAWGFPLRYRVAGAFADEVPTGESASFAIGDEGDIEIYGSAGAVGGTPDVAASVVAVVVSYGTQGNQAWTAAGFDCPGAGAGFSGDESENCDGDIAFVEAGYRPPDVDDGFDDMLTWIPYPVLSTRMVEADRLP